MKYADDSKFEAIISTMLCRLIPKEEALGINFKIFDEIIPLCQLWLEKDRHLLLINLEAKWLKDKTIFYAALAHEIGHLQNMKETNGHYEKNDAFRIAKELIADKTALVLLKKLFENPKEILLKEINFALEATLNCGFATREEIDLAKLFASVRSQAILID